MKKNELLTHITTWTGLTMASERSRHKIVLFHLSETQTQAKPVCGDRDKAEITTTIKWLSLWGYQLGGNTRLN